MSYFPPFTGMYPGMISSDCCLPPQKRTYKRHEIIDSDAYQCYEGKNKHRMTTKQLNKKFGKMLDMCGEGAQIMQDRWSKRCRPRDCSRYQPRCMPPCYPMAPVINPIVESAYTKPGYICVPKNITATNFQQPPHSYRGTPHSCSAIAQLPQFKYPSIQPTIDWNPYNLVYNQMFQPHNPFGGNERSMQTDAKNEISIQTEPEKKKMNNVQFVRDKSTFEERYPPEMIDTNFPTVGRGGTAGRNLRPKHTLHGVHLPPIPGDKNTLRGSRYVPPSSWLKSDPTSSPKAEAVHGGRLGWLNPRNWGQ
jgi:hypothetical protein